MKSVSATPRYESALRAGQKAATRQGILDAAGRLMQDGGLTELSFAAVAREAGVRERTVFRHFANKEALLDALWDWLDPRIGVSSFPRSERELVERPRQVFRAFDDHEHLMRAFWSSPHGREFRLRVNDRRTAAIQSSVADAGRGLSRRERRWLAALAQLIYSGAAWQTMKDYWDFDGAEAGEAASFGLTLLFDAARRRGAAKKGDHR